MLRLVAQRIDAGAFEPYGEVLSLADHLPRHDFAGRVRNTRASAWPNLALIRPPVAIKSQIISQMERHKHSTQAFFPLDVEAYLVVVSPPADAGPRCDRVGAFFVPSGIAISYHAGTWHTSMRVIGRVGVMAMLVHEDGTDDDTEIRPVEPFQIVW